MNNEKKIKLEIWGTYPPPFGGVTVHLKRLYSFLYQEEYFETIFLNFNGHLHLPNKGIYRIHFWWLPFFLLPFKKKRILHIHTRQILAWSLIRILGFKHHKVLTLHNEILRFKKGKIIRYVIRFALAGFDRIILNDKSYGSYLIERFKLNSHKLVYSGAFLPPLKSEFVGLPEEIEKFRLRKKFLLSATAWQLVILDGHDLYGLDILIDLIFELKKEKYDIGLVFVLPQKGETEYYEKIKAKIKQLELSNDILIYEKGLPNAFEVWANSDLFLRPTYSDIEGLSVHEALFTGTPVIASDVCPRPKNCFTYHYGNFDELLNLTKEVLDGKRSVAKIDYSNENSEKIKSVYLGIVNKVKF